MMFTKRSLILFIIILTISSCTNTEETEKINSNLKLWYNQPAEKWTEALPIGNGRLGAMVFGGIINIYTIKTIFVKKFIH